MAGAHSSRTWRDLEADDFARVMAVNVTGAFLMCQQAALAMEQQRTGGAIVLASSNAMTVGGLGGNGRGGPAYVSTKAAIIGLTRALARSLAPLDIRVNAIAPGSTRTPMTASYSEAALELVAARTLAGRIGEAQEMAAAASFLISADASYVYGEILNVNGGGSFGL
jgi:3-oxoacyl-[acyl-carrier protein] reductase